MRQEEKKNSMNFIATYTIHTPPSSIHNATETLHYVVAVYSINIARDFLNSK